MQKLLYILLLLPVTLIAQHTVSGTFSPATDFTYAFLYKATPEGADYVDRGKLDDSGHFEIKLDSSLTAGIYKIVYAIPPEENNFDFIYNGKESVAFNFSNDEGVDFTASIENKLWNSYLKSMSMVNQTINNYYTKESTDEAAYLSIFKTLKEAQLNYEASANGKLVSAFIAANRPYIPKAFEDLDTYLGHLKDNYLQHIDFSDYLLQSSSFITERVNSYVFDLNLNPNTAIYKTHISEVAAAIPNENITIKTSLLEILWQRFVSLENHVLANYITDNYLLDLANKSNNKVLAQRLVSYKNTSIGTKAPNFDITNSTTKTNLHALEGSEYYLLIFWSSSCGHCLNELPKVSTLVTDKTDLQVVAFGLEKETDEWTNAIKDFPNFIHNIGLGKWEHPIVSTYGITATPMYFLLSKDKIIMAKPYSFEDLEVVLKSL